MNLTDYALSVDRDRIRVGWAFPGLICGLVLIPLAYWIFS